jgi:hypothetical protein
MANNPEDFGPLTPVELQELAEHVLSGESLYEANKEIEWLTSIVNNTPESDVAYKRFNTQLEQAIRYSELKKRYDTYGDGPVVELTQTFR